MTNQPTHHGYAVNVKVHNLYGLDQGTLTNEQVEEIWEGVADQFWSHLNDIIAPKYGFAHIYSEGRMGGWAVPDPQPTFASEWPEEITEWWESEVFRPFEKDVLSALEDFTEQYKQELKDAVKRAAAEPIEAAYWAARDVMTF